MHETTAQLSRLAETVKITVQANADALSAKVMESRSDSGGNDDPVP
jgi:hypothetical protein